MGDLASACLALLGPDAEPVACVGPGAAALRRMLEGRVRCVDAVNRARGVVVSFLGSSMGAAERRRLLADVGAAVRADGGAFVLVDHNQPRRWLARAIGVVALRLRGMAPERARYLVARELQDVGFRVETLRLARGERVQLVRARTTPTTASTSSTGGS